MGAQVSPGIPALDLLGWVPWTGITEFGGSKHSLGVWLFGLVEYLSSVCVVAWSKTFLLLLLRAFPAFVYFQVYSLDSPFTFLPPPSPALEIGEGARAATPSFIRFLDDEQLHCLPFGAVCYESGSRCSCIGLNLGTDILSLERVCEWHCCVMRQTHAKLRLASQWCSHPHLLGTRVLHTLANIWYCQSF